MRIGVLILSVATLAFLVWLGMSGGVPRTSVELDGRQDAYRDPRRTIARIQSDLERTAAGHQAWPLPPGIVGDPLEAIVDAYRLFLDGNTKGADARLNEIAATANGRLNAVKDTDPETGARISAYFAQLGAAAGGGPPTARLLAGLRLVDGVLFLEAAHWTQADPQSRTILVAGPPSPLNGTWLRLPCRTIIGRVAALREAAETLGPLAGPLLACPSDQADLAVLEAQAKAPAMLPTRVAPIATRAFPLRSEPSAPPTPWDHETAVAWMDEDPDAAEPVLAAAATPAEKLDYALFLHAFRPAGPDNQSRIHTLLQAVDTATLAKATTAQGDAIGRPAAYDGSDDSLLVSLRLATATETAPGYALPCAVLQARPGLLAATTPLPDMAAPVSGCTAGRGAVRGFPDAEVAAFITAAEDADGHFLAHRGGAPSPTQQAALEMLKLAPRALAALEPPTMDHPYQVWGLVSLGNRAVEQRITPLYRDAAAKLAAWYGRQGLTADEAARAAKSGLFRVVWGANCGDGAPTPSLRGLVLDRAPIAEIRETLSGKEAPETQRCAVHAGLDPLAHLAVGHPPALTLLLDHGTKADERNGFGKTPLMVAAQANQLDSVRLLLDRGASANATTWQQDPALTLAHDGRTPLMYAAAHAGLPVIKLLVERGADPHLADTKGRRPIDYLLGFGPMPANPVLSPDERADAARLLY
ncbi:MAG: ankyrin repeat domain-containing protein [Bacteroidota bacterium]